MLSSGDDVAKMGNLFNSAISAQRHFILLAARHSKPADAELQKCLEPQIKAITAVTEFREASRRSNFFNHLSSVSEAIPGNNFYFLNFLKMFKKYFKKIKYLFFCKPYRGF